MKKYLFIFFLTLSTSICFSEVVTYHKDTGEVMGWVVSGETGYEKNPDYMTINLDSLPSKSFDDFKISTMTKLPVVRPQEEKQLILKARRRIEIRQEIRKLKQRYFEALEERAVSPEFDVSLETATIRVKVIDLKTEYDSLQ